ncbi:dihydrofolate reductase [Heyndrickxia ginsengihumi]|uniref:Dihydrofolate reductase n=1 Tax=Heyndrickxia ginsengihumi TaxID=363870 RepID=A0A0A6Y180_9BACI|nr:dihydrofolate reductase [Heyndrickxia ginsengihumi]KHD86057.1 dihydrofolate reductase [Heyndrickxia ginsengihumi]MBE6184225.1 dihydrofolate reductase [Bacillus sp. (in: firmicutes)]MCM3023479.1 dihydrofolate reductase [Heyndrickxia ginsengihumi]
MISFLWAQDEKGIIGKDNQLPWHLPEDLKYFKELTWGHPIVMGRKTYESIGKALPGRTNVILTRDSHFHAENCLVFSNKHDLLRWAYEKNEEIFITGGAEIFALLLDDVDRLYMTKIHEDIEGDTYFPMINWNEWQLISSKRGLKNEKNPYDYEFLVYQKI